MLYASPTATAAEIQAMLATDSVTLANAAYYPFVATQNVNSSAALLIPPTRTLDLNGSTIFFAGIANQTLDADSATLIGWQINSVGGTLRNGILRGPDNRVPVGGRPACGNRLLNVSANGVVFAGLFEDLVLMNGQAQALALYNVNGLTLRRVSTPRPTTLPTTAGHYIDVDVTANDRVTQALVFENCDLDAYAGECLKMENVTNIRFKNTRFRNAVTLVQDLVPYSSFSDVEFDSQCRFDSRIAMANLRRRSVAGVPDNLGAGTLVIRGRFVGDSALIYGADSTPTGDTNANMYANVTAEFCSFEGANSHILPTSGSAWLTKSSGIKSKVTVFVRTTSAPGNGVYWPIAPDANSTNNAVSSTLNTSLSTANIALYFLATRGVTVNLEETTLTGANNLGSSWSGYTGICPIDFVGAGVTKTIIDAQGAAVGCTFNQATNTAKQRLIGVTIKNATNRAWLVNNAVVDIEMYNVLSQDCTTNAGGGGGRLQAYAAAYLGPGTSAKNCTTTGATNGGGYLVSASGTAPVTVEGVRVEGCTSDGNSGGLHNQSAYLNIKSLELVNNRALAGIGGMLNTFAVAGVTVTYRNISGRGNVGSGLTNDVGLITSTATGKIVFAAAVLGSGGTNPLSKTGGGELDYGNINLGLTGAVSVAGGVNTLNQGANQSSDPLFVTDTTSVALQSTSPCKGVATPNWTINTARPTLSYEGRWFQLNSTNLTTMGARP